MNHWKLLWRLLDSCDGFINGDDKALSCSRGVLEISVEGLKYFYLCLLANPQEVHLPTLPSEFGLDLGPRLARFGIGVRLGLTPTEFGSERRSYRCGGCRIQAVPQVSNEFDPLLRGQLLDDMGE